MDKCREAFEKWFLTQYKVDKNTIFLRMEESKEEYEEFRARGEWWKFKEIWNASHDNCIEECNKVFNNADVRTNPNCDLEGYQIGVKQAVNDITYAIQNDKVKL